MQKKKLNDHRFDVYYEPNRPIIFPNDCHLGSKSILTLPVGTQWLASRTTDTKGSLVRDLAGSPFVVALSKSHLPPA